MIFKIRKDQRIHRALRDLKIACGLSLLDHWEYRLDQTDSHYIIKVVRGLPPYVIEEDLMIWKMTYT
jgi:hypothetical protein